MNRGFAKALSTGVTAALFAGCGGSPPIGAPGAMPQQAALAFRTNNAHYSVVYSFGAPPDGNFPFGGLIEVRGTLYGTTSGGGSNSLCYGSSSNYGGTVFSVTPSGTEKVLHTFSGNGTDGCGPRAGLIDVGGTLYGTTLGGGNYGCGVYSGYNYDPCGTVFSIDTTGKEKVLHLFGHYGTGDGDDPFAPLIDVKGKLYGTTSGGGKEGCDSRAGYHYTCGTVFTITPAGVEKVLYDFRKGNHGHDSRAGLIDVGSTLYGTTYDGGDYDSCGYGKGCGTVFSLALNGKESKLHTFGTASDGQLPLAGLIELNSTLYGTTKRGGTYGYGTVFSITPGGVEKVLHSFDSTDGATPQASLIDVNGVLYGTTSGGGAYGDGTVFSISTTGEEKVLHSFSGGSDGSAPYASLLNVKGTLYGTTSGAFGFDGYGTVFALTL